MLPFPFHRQDASAPVDLVGVGDLLADAEVLLRHGPAETLTAVAEARRRIQPGRWTALVSGLRSVGKSSFVCALWGDSELLPTAVRDCTQTNTLIRRPDDDEADRTLRLVYLPRDRAQEFATRGLAFHRLAELLQQVEGPLGPRIDQGHPSERLEKAVAAVRQLFAQRQDVAVLYEPYTEPLEQLEQFAAYLDTPDFAAGQCMTAPWSERREYLMGRRRPDGRTLDVGKLLSLARVEVLRETDRWGDGRPRLLDSPWIPAFHNARRQELIVEQAREIDVLVIITLPEPLELEDWVRRVFRDQPDLPKRTLVVFNQVDTVDRSALFGYQGFAEAYEKTRAHLAEHGIPEDNLLMSCARLPFLEGLPPDPLQPDRLDRLRKVLDLIRNQTLHRREDAFVTRLRQATDPADAGIASLRERLCALGDGPARRAAARSALALLSATEPEGLDADRREAWTRIQQRATDLRFGR